MLVAMSLIPLGDTGGKLMTDQSAFSPFFAAWSRFAVGALILAFFVRRAAYKLLFDWRIIARASILICGITSILAALSTVTIATVYMVFFIGPLISYILAVLFLKEPIGLLHLALVAGAFTGVLIVSQPQGQCDPNLAFAVLVGLCYGVFLRCRARCPKLRHRLRLRALNWPMGHLFFCLLRLGIGRAKPLCWFLGGRYPGLPQRLACCFY